MSVSIGCVCNFYNEIHALPGFLELHSQFFDHLSFYQAGPQGAESDDGSIELLEKWKMPIHRGKIDDGFGIVRTATVRSSPCEWVMLLDADERFHHRAQVLTCSGESTPRVEVDKALYDYGDPNYKEPEVLQGYDKAIEFAKCPSNFENMRRLGAKLTVSFGDVYNQGAWLRSLLDHHTTLDAVATIRRHWHDFSWQRPTQNWHTDPDYQRRLVRNIDRVHWSADTRMHEQLVGAENVYQPDQTHGPFFDHYHLHYKKMEIEQRRHDVDTYDRIYRGENPLTWEEFQQRKS